MKRDACTIVGIAGGSGSGKTTLAERLKSAIGSDKVAILSLDSYYKDLSNLSSSQRQAYNFDHPSACDISMLVSHLNMLKTGQSIPKVDFDHTLLCRKMGPVLLEPHPVILLEGILALAIPSLRELTDIKVFIDTSADIRFIRRCQRDIIEYKRTFDDVAKQYASSVRYMHYSLVEPSKDFADLILPFDKPNDRGIDLLIRSLATLATKQPPRTIFSELDEAEMILIPAGDFIMGTTETQITKLIREYGAEIQWFNDERPARTVRVPPFYIDKYPVTNRQFEKFLKATGYKEPEMWRERRFHEPNFPVVGVTWDDVIAYSKWIGKRLATEAEWEKAARGVNARLFPWGDGNPEGKANFGNRHGGPTPVEMFDQGASPYGVMDMAGNVWEWINDWYERNYYSKAPADSPRGPNMGIGRGVRGGSWINNPTMIRCAERDYRRLPHRDLKYFGFRCVKDPD